MPEIPGFDAAANNFNLRSMQQSGNSSCFGIAGAVSKFNTQGVLPPLPNLFDAKFLSPFSSKNQGRKTFVEKFFDSISSGVSNAKTSASSIMGVSEVAPGTDISAPTGSWAASVMASRSGDDGLGV